MAVYYTCYCRTSVSDKCDGGYAGLLHLLLLACPGLRRHALVLQLVWCAAGGAAPSRVWRRFFGGGGRVRESYGNTLVQQLGMLHASRVSFAALHGVNIMHGQGAHGGWGEGAEEDVGGSLGGGSLGGGSLGWARHEWARRGGWGHSLVWGSHEGGRRGEGRWKARLELSTSMTGWYNP